MRLELAIQPGIVHVQRIRVLHGELAHADQPAARARLVAELSLQVVDKLRKLAVGADLAARQVSHHLLVGHGQGHVAAGAVLPMDQFRVSGVPAAGLLPQIARLRDRHGDFLPADRVHLLADDGLDLVQTAARQRQIRIDARAEGLNEAGARKQLVAGQLRISRRVAQSLEECFGLSHGWFSS